MDNDTTQQLIDLVKIIALSGIAGNFMSLFVSAIVAADFAPRAKEIIAVLTCVAASVIGILLTGLDYTNIAIVFPAFIVGCLGSYRLWWKPTGIASWLEDILITNKNDKGG